MITALLTAALLATPIMGGDTVTINGNPCVVGFNAKTGSGAHRVLVLGSCVGSTQTLVAATPPAGTSSTPYVRVPGSTPITVRGAAPAPIGAPVCIATPTSGYQCGTVQAKNVTVNFPGGTITGLTRTSICPSPRNGGTPVMWRDQAQGVVVGGSGSCTSGGATYFAPVVPALVAWGVTLHTG
jgi:streptogrisin B